MIKTRYLEQSQLLIQNHIFRKKFDFIEEKTADWEALMVEKQNSPFIDTSNIKCPDYERDFKEEDVLIDLNDKQDK